MTDLGANGHPTLSFTEIECDNGTRIFIRDAYTEIHMPGGKIVPGAPQYNDEQAETAKQLGYVHVERMIEDHDPLHALLCDWLGLPTSFALEVATGDRPEGDRMASIEEHAVLAVQRFMVLAGGKLPKKKPSPVRPKRLSISAMG